MNKQCNCIFYIPQSLLEMKKKLERKTRKPKNNYQR